MHTIKVRKNHLLQTLKENRENHVGSYEEALEAYRQKSIELLEEHIERIRTGAVEKVFVSLPPPENYEEEYDRAIAMVEWHEEHLIELDEHQFDNYVRDQWNWKDKFIQTNSLYTDR